MNLAHRTINNAVFNTLGWLLPIGLNFIFTPYIVHKLGTEAYGILALVWTVIGYFALLNLGLANALVKYIAEYNAEGDADKTNEVIGTTLLIFLVLGLFGGIVILSLAKIIVIKFLKIPPDLIPIAYTAFCVGAGCFLLNMVLSVFSVIPNGLNRYDITSIVTMIMGSFTVLGTAFLLYLAFGLVEIVVLNGFVSFLGIMIYIFLSKRLLPTLRFKPVINYRVVRTIMHFGFFSTLSRIAYLINYQADRIVIGAILGVSWVAYYVVPFMILHRITSITVRIGMVIFPAISELQGHKRYDTIEHLYLTSSRVVVAVSASLCLPLLVFRVRLLTLWMGQDFGEKSSTVFLLFILTFFLSAVTNVPTSVVDGLGKPKISGISAMASTIIYLGLIIPLARYMGISGIATAFLISQICVAPVFIWYVNNRIVQIPLPRLLREAYAKPLFAGFLMSIPLNVIPQDRIDNIFALLGVIIMSTAGYFAIASLIGVFPREERKILFDYLGMILKKHGRCVGYRP